MMKKLKASLIGLVAAGCLAVYGQSIADENSVMFKKGDVVEVGGYFNGDNNKTYVQVDPNSSYAPLAKIYMWLYDKWGAMNWDEMECRPDDVLVKNLFSPGSDCSLRVISDTKLGQLKLMNKKLTKNQLANIVVHRACDTYEENIPMIYNMPSLITGISTDKDKKVVNAKTSMNKPGGSPGFKRLSCKVDWECKKKTVTFCGEEVKPMYFEAPLYQKCTCGW